MGSVGVLMAIDARDAVPFKHFPSKEDIASYFWNSSARVNNGYAGIDLYRGEGGDYCYLWVETACDFDMYKAYLLDIRTHRSGNETRDWLFVWVGSRSRIIAEWYGHPIGFDAPSAEHRDRFVEGMYWMTGLIDKQFEIESDKSTREIRRAARMI